MSTSFVTVPKALEEFAQGRIIVVVDDEDRENEGDLTLAAEFVSPEAINFMARFGRGLICLTLTEERTDELQLGLMSQENTSRFGTAFTTSIEAREGVTTGISARDRAHTIRVAIDPRSTAKDLARPGHVFPLRARRGGVLVRAGQTEASVDLARLTGLKPAGVICEIMNDDGTMARVPDLVRFCKEHGLMMLTVADLIRYRLRTERYVHRAAECTLATQFADFRALTFTSDIGGGPHTALLLGNIDAGDPVLVRVHTQCLAGDVFEATECDCRHVVRQSLQAIAREGRGVLVYLNPASRSGDVRRPGDPLSRVLCCAPHGAFAHERSERTIREVGIGSQILRDVGVRKIRLLTNTLTHVPALQGFELEIVDYVPLPAISILERPADMHHERLNSYL
jgi:3,4-dihydroxy 2-butanone 4-phosphate synthase/GTP cyclohydrolase II